MSDDDVVRTCMYAGWFPHLPPTPASFGLGVSIRTLDLRHAYPRKVDLAPVVPLDEESSRALRRATYSRIFPLRPSTTG